MKFLVIKTFRDKFTEEKHLAGEIVEYTKKRATEINKAPQAPFLEEHVAAPIAENKEPEEEPEQGG